MNEIRKISLWAILLSFSFLLLNCEKDEDEEINLSDKEAVIKLYTEKYLASDASDLGWTGNTDNCQAGKISDDAQAKTLQRINYFRELAGLPTDIEFNDEWNSQCQEAALMMHANNSLSHGPPSNWKCYTENGSTAAGKSNLGLGRAGPRAIDMYIQDNGNGNEACGHRRWILYSKAGTMGHGCTSRADALWVIGGSKQRENLPEFIAWPPANYTPAPLVYARWSFAISGADFSDATISMKNGSGNSVELQIVYRNGGYGDKAIVWEPSGIDTSIEQTYNVTIDNVVVDGETKSYNYKVTVIQVTE